MKTALFLIVAISLSAPSFAMEECGPRVAKAPERYRFRTEEGYRAALLASQGGTPDIQKLDYEDARIIETGYLEPRRARANSSSSGPPRRGDYSINAGYEAALRVSQGLAPDWDSLSYGDAQAVYQLQVEGGRK